MSAQATSAQDEPGVMKRTGVELAARSGYSLPLGEAQKGIMLSDIIAWQVPMELDLGYREGERLTVGLYFQYGLAGPAPRTDGACRLPDISCSAHALRGGIQVLWHLGPRKPMGGWLSLGIGAEQILFAFDSSAADVHYTVHYTGLEAISVQAGLDFRSRSGASAGPFVGLLTGKYFDAGSDCTGSGCSGYPGGSLDQTAYHNWFVLGVRGALLL